MTILGTYKINSQIKFKTLMIKSSLCDCSYAYILVSETKTAPSTGTAANLNDKKITIIKNCAHLLNA